VTHVPEHLTLDIWETETGAVNWSLRCLDKERPNWHRIESMILETVEGLIDAQDGNRVVFHIIAQREGMTTTRWDTRWKFTTFGEFLWVRANLYRAHWHILGRQALPKFMFMFWAIEWVYHRLAGHFKQSESVRAAPATPIPATPTNTSLDLSEALLGQSQASGGTVIPFRRNKDKS